MTEGAVTESDHGAEEHVARLTRTFFSQPPAGGDMDAWSDESVPPPPMAAGARRAMYATVAIFAGFALVLLGYLTYTRLIMPVPVDLSSRAAMPELELVPAAAAPPAAAPAPAPRPAEEAVLDRAGGDEGASAAAEEGAREGAGVNAEEGASAAAEQGASAEPGAGEDEGASVDVVEAPSDDQAVAAATAPRDPRVGAALQRAHALYARGQHAQALSAYEAVLDLDSNAAAALSRVAYLHLNAGDDARARTYATRAVEVDATSSEGWIVLGASLEALRDRGAARAAYQKCAELGQGDYVTECRRLAR